MLQRFQVDELLKGVEDAEGMVKYEGQSVLRLLRLLIETRSKRRTVVFSREAAAVRNVWWRGGAPLARSVLHPAQISPLPALRPLSPSTREQGLPGV